MTPILRLPALAPSLQRHCACTASNVRPDAIASTSKSLLFTARKKAYLSSGSASKPRHAPAIAPAIVANQYCDCQRLRHRCSDIAGYVTRSLAHIITGCRNLGSELRRTPGQTICTMCSRAIYRHAHPYLSSGSASKPRHAPAIAPAIVAMLSVSLPILAQAWMVSQGSPLQYSNRPIAAGMDSWAAVRK